MSISIYEKIAIMQAFATGKKLQARANIRWVDCPDPSWNWFYYDYRIAPQPVEEAARAFVLSNFCSNGLNKDKEKAFLAGAKWQNSIEGANDYECN